MPKFIDPEIENNFKRYINLIYKSKCFKKEDKKVPKELMKDILRCECAFPDFFDKYYELTSEAFYNYIKKK